MQTHHWNQIYATKQDQELGWYEHDNQQTLKFLDDIKLDQSTRIFIPGAGTSRLIEDLLNTQAKLILNDISDVALDKVRQRIAPHQATFVRHNMGNPLAQSYPCELWIDRAVLHFLTEPQAIKQYFATLKQSVVQNGYVLLAQFSKNGATRCAGLDVHRYDLEELHQQLGDEFRLLAYEEHMFTTPAGTARPYIYAFYQRAQ